MSVARASADSRAGGFAKEVRGINGESDGQPAAFPETGQGAGGSAACRDVPPAPFRRPVVRIGPRLDRNRVHVQAVFFLLDAQADERFHLPHALYLPHVVAQELA